MRINEIIQPTKPLERVTDVMEDIDEIAHYVESECSEILAVYQAQGDVLYRGFSNMSSSDADSGTAFVSSSPENRLPMTSRIGSQEVVDAALKANGHYALRSNSIFVGSEKMAKGYSLNLFAIFPLDTFDFTWSPDIPDVITQLEFKPFHALGQLKNMWDVIRGYRHDHLIDYDERGKSQGSTPLRIELIKIMQFIEGDRKFVIDWHHSVREWNDIKATLNDNISKKFAEQIDIIFEVGYEAWIESIQKFFAKTHIESAMDLDHEVFIHGEYLAVPIEVLDELKDRLSIGKYSKETKE